MIPRVFTKWRQLCLFLMICIVIAVLNNLLRLHSSDTQRQHDQPVQVLPQSKLTPDGTLVHHQTLGGSVFLDSSQTLGFMKPIVTSVIHSFSPDVLVAVKKMFQDKAGDNMYYATLPAIISKNGTILLVQRIWLGQYEFAPKHHVDLHWTNTWQENYLYIQTFDENYQPITKGELLAIPTTTNCWYDYRSDGPMDPRLISIQDEIFLVFHTWLSSEKGDPSKIAGRVHLWDFQEKAKIKLEVTDMPLMKTEINWCPVIKKGTLYLLYSFDPLRVLRCNHRDGQCELVFTSEDAHKHTFNHSLDHLRGGTPFVEYKYPYYISLAHSVVVTLNNWAFYTMHLVMISVEPQFRIVYVTSPIEVSRKLLESVPVVRNFTIMAPFVYPVGIIAWTDDVIDIGVHLNDYNGHVIRMRGVKDIVSKAIEIDIQHGNKRGAYVRRVQAEVAKSIDHYTGQNLKLKSIHDTGPHL